jgi:hypothetical protein
MCYSAECDEGWIFDGHDSCMKLFTTPKNWDHARKECNLESSELFHPSINYSYILEDYFVSFR